MLIRWFEISLGLMFNYFCGGVLSPQRPRMLLFPNLLLFCSATRLISFFLPVDSIIEKKETRICSASKEWHFTLLFSINALINQCLNHWCLHWFHVITHWRERNEKQLIPFILFFFKWFYSMAWIFIYSNYSNFVC